MVPILCTHPSQCGSKRPLSPLPLTSRKGNFPAKSAEGVYHIEEEGAVVFAHACQIGAEGILSKRVDAPCRSGPHSAWIKVRNPASIAVQRERSENWDK